MERGRTMNGRNDGNIEQTLKNVFGFDSFREGQRPIVEKLIAGRPTLAVFPTGAGKSLCYQLPALHLDGLTLVVSPLIALMKDQIDFLVSKGVAAARLDSSLTGKETREVWEGLRSGNLKILYIAPERFSSERFLERIRRTKLALMVVDEAHCISEWGHNFRPEYLKLARIAKNLGVSRILALTATATPAVADDIRSGFEIAAEDYVNTGFHRPNLVMRASPCTIEKRDELLIRRMKERAPGATIVYVTLQRTAEDVAEMLEQHGLEARAYHAGMDAERRHDVQDWFMASGTAIVVATIAFGMGIDKADIRYVYHYNVPKSLENYAQETGRAGRDGKASVCEMLACPEDRIRLENFSYGDTPTPDAVRAFVDEVLSKGARFDVSHYELSAAHDIRILVVSTLLCYLELEGLVEPTGPFYSVYKFQPNRPVEEIVSRFDSARADFLKHMFDCSRKAKKWFTIDVDEAAATIEEDRMRIIRALNYLEEQDELILKANGVRHGYRRLHEPADTRQLCAELIGRFIEAEKRDVGRIRDVLDLAGKKECIVSRLLSYFGEDLGGDCGHCDRCLGEQVPPMPPQRKVEIPRHAAQQAAETVKEGHSALATPRQQARFLCGLSSPATSRARPPLTRHELFGSLSGIPFADVLAFCEENRTTDEH